MEDSHEEDELASSDEFSPKDCSPKKINKKESIFDKLEVITVENIHQAFEHVFVNNPYKFEKII